MTQLGVGVLAAVVSGVVRRRKSSLTLVEDAWQPGALTLPINAGLCSGVSATHGGGLGSLAPH
jgi:hypothetical protein